MAVTLSLRNRVRVPIEVDGVLPESLGGLTTDAILRTVVSQGNVRLPLGEFFTASGSCADDLTIAWEGDLKAVKRIGQGLSAGRMLVCGTAGMHLGSQMSGGEIEVRGDVTDWAGAEMRGGRIRVHGSAGDCPGGAYRGSRRGMTGGEILIQGDAGNEVGRVLRRGLIAVGGRCGEFCGSRMIAGSIFVSGATGRRAGAGMKRGTIGLFGNAGFELLPTFKRAGTFHSVFLASYVSGLHAAGMEALAGMLGGRMERWCGDVLAKGMGEILLPAGGG